MKKVFISADIEGIANTTLVRETHKDDPGYYNPAAVQMTNEVVAACEGAIAAGAEYILIRDGHGTGCNIDVSRIPDCAEIIRNWSGHPYSMAYGIDSSFDAAMFVGYHSAAGREGNPLSHTMTGSPLWIKINGVKVSEFRLYSWACALEGVPTVFLSGDQMLCDDSADIHPNLVTVATKSGYGGMTRSPSTKVACDRIREGAEKALKQDLSNALCKLPEHFTFQVCYKDHTLATKKSYFPGFKKIDDNTIEMITDNYFDILTALQFILS